MRFSFLLIAAFCLSFSLHAQTVFECKDEQGNAVFSGSPCGDNAVKRKIDSSSVYSSTSSTPDDQSVKKSRLRSIDASIKKLHKEISTLTSRRDTELASYQKKIKRNEKKAGKNIKKAEIRNRENNQKVATINAKYNPKIADKKASLKKLEKEKSLLNQ